MSEPDRYFALITRQQRKLDYAPIIEHAFHEAVEVLGPNPSLTELARWLDGRVEPSASSKSGKWTAQTVKDWLYFDGIEPTEANLKGFWTETEGVNQSRKNKVRREAGHRFTAYEAWHKSKATIEYERGTERAAYEEQRLAEHLRQIEVAAQALRAALRIPH